MNIYKIQRSDGLFSNGGSRPKFTRIGKTWPNLGGLKNHLNVNLETHGETWIRTYYKDAKVVKFKLEKIYPELTIISLCNKDLV